MTTLMTCLNIGVVVTALIAAVLWFYSATVRVKLDETPDADGWTEASIADEMGNDILASQARGNKLSAYAAVAAGLSALLQATVFLLSINASPQHVDNACGHQQSASFRKKVAFFVSNRPGLNGQRATGIRSDA